MSKASESGTVQMPVCPGCGNDGSGEGEILYVDAVEQRRTVIRAEGGKLIIALEIEEEEVEEGHGYPALYCEACGRRWPVPEAVEANIDME
jgi:hypothetical protein